MLGNGITLFPGIKKTIVIFILMSCPAEELLIYHLWRAAIGLDELRLPHISVEEESAETSHGEMQPALAAPLITQH